MPAISLYGRRWHFSSDIVSVPALLSAFFHTAWIVILLVYAGATGSWPQACATSDGVAYIAVLGGLLFSYALNLAIDLALTLHSLRGAPFEASKRRWVAPLLYASTLPLVTALGLTVYGSYVTTHLEPDCWPVEQRNAVTNLAQGLVFSSWGFMAFASMGIAITYNMYPQHHDLSSWEARCECLASALCCHANVVRRPDGKRPPLTNIAELTAGLLSHCDLDATDMTAALFLAAAAQNRRRRLRIAKALLPVYRALREGAASPGSAAAAGAAAEEGLLPACRPGAGLNGHGRRRGGPLGGEEEEEDDDAASLASVSTASSLNDVPADRELDRELDRMAAEQHARRLAGEAPGGAQLAPAGQMLPEGRHDGAAQGRLEPPQQQTPAPAERWQRGHGKRVSWGQELTGPETAAAKVGLGTAAGSGGTAVDGPEGALQPRQLRDPDAAPQAEQHLPGDCAMASPFSSPGAAPAGLLEDDNSAVEGALPGEVAPTAGSTPAGAGPPAAAGGPREAATRLPLTEETVALLDQQLGTPPGGSPTRDSQLQAAAQQLAGELLQELPRELPHGQSGIVDQLAGAIEEEIEQLGGGRLPEDALLQVAKEDSLDLSALEVNPEAPSIWFSAAGSTHQHPPSSSAGQLSEQAAAPGADATETADAAAAAASVCHEEAEEGAGQGPAARNAGQGRGAGAAPATAAHVGEGLAAASPFASAGGAAAHGAEGSTGQVVGDVGMHAGGVQLHGSSQSSTIPGMQHAAVVEAAAAAALSAVADSAAGSAHEDHAAKAAAQAGPPAGEPVPPADEAAAATVAEVAAAAAGVAGPDSEQPSGSVAVAASARLSLQKQLTVRYPVVITPSEHADAFRGPLPAAALADIYAGRRAKVPSTVLQEAVHFLKFSYAVYSLEPRVEAPASALDICACMAAPPDPQQVVFKGLSELEALEDDASVELLHLNCSNRVLSHLPYMICLDHGKRAVVLAIRGTISAADIVTDAIVYPEPLDSFLPPDIKEELSEPAFAHAGMVAAARAIFRDMTERGILQQLVEEEAVGDYTAPQGQQARRDGGTASNATAAGSVDGAGAGGSDRAASVPSPPGRQYDADADSSGPSTSRYALASGGRGGQGVGARHSGQQPAAGGGPGDGSAGGPPSVNRQSSGRADAAGRLWEGTAGSAAEPDNATGGGQAPGERRPQAGHQREQRRSQGADTLHQGAQLASVTGVAGRKAGSTTAGRGAAAAAGRGDRQQAPGRRVGEIMRQKIQEEGWQLIVEGHSLGAGAAALVSLKLRQHFPGLKCIAYSCPGGLVSKNLAHAMASFVTTVAVGKDAVCRATVGNLARLMDEMVTALARCRQPKMAVLLWPWWRRQRADFRRLFYDYDEIPAEPLEVLHHYYESRARIGQPLSMYPPGRLIFLRPIKTRVAKEWDAVWIRPEDIIAEGLLVSRHALRDHLLSTVYEALTAAASRMEDVEGGAPGALSGEVEARPAPAPAPRRLRARGPAPPMPRRAAQRRWRARLQAQRSGSLQAVLIEAT